MLDRGENDDWFGSPFIRIMAVLAVLASSARLLAVIARKPVVNLDVFKDKILRW